MLVSSLALCRGSSPFSTWWLLWDTPSWPLNSMNGGLYQSCPSSLLYLWKEHLVTFTCFLVRSQCLNLVLEFEIDPLGLDDHSCTPLVITLLLHSFSLFFSCSICAVIAADVGLCKRSLRDGRHTLPDEQFLLDHLQSRWSPPGFTLPHARSHQPG